MTAISFYLLTMLVGALLVLVYWLEPLVARIPLSLPILFVALGFALFRLVPGLHPADLYDPVIAEHLIEIVLIVALMGAGLNIDRPFSLRGWQTAWRLLGIAMPLTIVAILLLAHAGGYGWPAALLLAGALAPTDPVLAADVAAGPPNSGEEGEIRFGLTSEAGLNDGLAFPFVQLAILLTTAPLAEEVGSWVVLDLFVKVAGGAMIGFLLGRFFGWIVFILPGEGRFKAGDGIVALGIAMAVYGSSELLHTNGFVATFVAALVFRAICPRGRFNRAMAMFSGEIERLLVLLVLLMFGGGLAYGLLAPLRWIDIGIGLAVLLVIRPLAGWIGLIGSPHPPVSRAVTAFFGIRGIGTMYYLVHASNDAHFADMDALWALASFVISASILLHGVTATPLMTWADRIRAASPSPVGR